MRVFEPSIPLVAFLVALFLGVSAASADTKQTYTNDWKKNPDKGYYAQVYTAKVSVDVTIKQQIVYYPNECDGNNPDKCRHWVYWYNSEGKCWARCPTPYHPEYGKRVKSGDELWQTVKKPSEEKDVSKVFVDVNVSAVFKVSAEKGPFVKGTKEPITCVDWSKLP